MLASKVAARGGREIRAPPNDKIKLKHPSAKLLGLISAYLYVPLSTVEHVVDPIPPQNPMELLFGGMEDEDDDEEELLGKRALEHEQCVDKATLSYYENLPSRHQCQNTWEAGAASPRPGRGYGRGMPGLARDVLRWLVGLNLSFPIKNIKRDFSNGFMVAEIFSRYCPADVHMHSYDYGSRAASKRDNWEQLNKVFKKKGFVVQSHEIDDIVNCRSEEAAGQLLGRMYNFLTLKGCKPGDHESNKPFKQQNGYYEQWNSEGPLEAPLGNGKQNHDRLSCSESATSSYNQGDYEEDTCYSRPIGALSAEDLYHGAIKLDPKYESDSLLKMDDQDFAFNFTDSSENIPRFALREEEQRQRNRSSVQFARNNGSNAVEKARQREGKKEVQMSKAGARGEELRLAELASKARVEAGLAFRSPHRERTYKQYTLPDYRQQKQFGYVELGSLGPGDPSPELFVKREKLAQRKEFGRHARSCNIMSHANPTLVDYSKTIKTDAASARKKALAFASKIPKPKLKVLRKEAQENLLPLQNPHAMSDLQILEAKHQSDKLHVESIRRDLEQYLR